MLYVIHCANHPELAYRGGQQPIIHLEADLHQHIHKENSILFPKAQALEKSKSSE